MNWVLISAILALQPMPWEHQGLAVIRPDGSIYLPQDAAEELMAHLEWAEKAPELCEEEKAAERDILMEQMVENAKELEKAKSAQMSVAVPVAVGAIGIIVGLIAGFFAGSQK